MDKLKKWVALAALGALVILAAGWSLLVSPKRSEAADVRAQVDARVMANSALSTQLSVLKSQAKQLPAQQAKLASVAAKIPDNPALPSLIRAMTEAAGSAGVELVSLAPSTPAPVVAAVAATAAVVPTGAAAPTASSSGAGSLQQIGLAVNVVGGYFQIAQFMDALENLKRSFKVTAFTAIPGVNPAKAIVAGAPAVLDTGKSLSATITGQVYMAVGRADTALTPTTAK